MCIFYAFVTEATDYLHVSVLQAVWECLRINLSLFKRFLCLIF